MYEKIYKFGWIDDAGLDKAVKLKLLTDKEKKRIKKV